MDRSADPYRTLGVLRGATDAQVKAAHRRLAKRFHPDAPEGDTDRFLAIQEAYLLLSDPLRRREWDRLHGAGPVAAGEPGRSRARAGGAGPRARSGGTTGRGSGGSTGRSGARTGARTGPAEDAGAGDGAGTGAGAGANAEPPPDGSPWSANDRDPASRSTTWSAAGVPWWEDFAPRDKRAGNAGSSGAAPGGTSAGPGGAPRAAGARTHAPGAAAGGAHRTTASRSPEDIDVYSRSSGAAWSMAARRYFRKGEADLPKGGAWTYRGTQVVTGAEARKVAAEQAEERRRAAEELLAQARRDQGAAPAPRTAFSHEPSSPPRPDPTPPPARPATSRNAPGPQPAPTAAATPPRPAAAASTATPERRTLLERVRRAIGKG